MSFLERMYLLAIVKGMIITIKHLFTRKVTIQYPEQVRERSPVYRGQHQLKRDEQGENCTACGLCVIMSCGSNHNDSGRAYRMKTLVQRRKICFDI
jgi:formate hydrogenlyase subunit 6/NADH:ubiquinone oxidoreductase subunit I